jgi:hypothetical protein
VLPRHVLQYFRQFCLTSARVTALPAVLSYLDTCYSTSGSSVLSRHVLQYFRQFCLTSSRVTVLPAVLSYLGICYSTSGSSDLHRHMLQYFRQFWLTSAYVTVLPAVLPHVLPIQLILTGSSSKLVTVVNLINTGQSPCNTHHIVQTGHSSQLHQHRAVSL